MKTSNLDDGTNINIKKWYEEYQKAECPSKHGKSEIEVLDLKAEAKKCLDSESTAYHLKQSKSHNSEYSWLKTALLKGTTADKVAAGIVLIQNSPKHNLNHLTTLMSQVKVAKHNQCSMVINALKDLFLTDLLHPEYKLLKFEEQDLNQLDTYNKTLEDNNEENFKTKPSLSKNKLLSIWYFEDQLKDLYDRFVTSLSSIANDTVDTNREKAVVVMNELLMGNPEQEQKLLDFLVNKIGDPSSKVASKAIFCFTKLLFEHPNMKLIVLQEIEKLLFRTNVAQRAQYFAICLLTQFVLSKENTEVANTLIDVYFAFFKACLKKGEPDSRMMAAILTGVNRAYPFADINSIKLNEHIDSVYKVVHIGSFNVSLNALSLLFQVVGKNPNQSDRFYSAFYRKLLDPQIGVANKRAIFLNLLYRVLRNDQSILRLHAFIKRILQISLYFSANMICATLYVISQVLRSKKYSDKILTKSVITVENSTKEDMNNTKRESNEKKNSQNIEKENTILLSNIIVEDVKNDSDVKLENVEIKTEFKATSYNPYCRNPLHSGATYSFYSELEAFTKHFHPSVSLFANTIIDGKPIEYTGDPLEDLSLIRFLDRYVFKNPKKLENKKISKKNDPLAQRAAYTPKGIRSLPVDSLAYLNEREDRIPVDERFLYEYLNKRKEFRCASHTPEDDNESINSEDFNNMLDKLSKNKDLDELDVAGDFGTTSRKTKNIDNDDDEDDNDVDNDIDDEVSNDSYGEVDFDEGDDKEFQNFDDLDLEDIDDDISDMEFDDDDKIDELPKKRKKNKTNEKSNKKQKGLDDNTFVSAEEFAEMLENQGRSKFKYGASNALSDRDGASAKQLDWETARNQRISGFSDGKKRKTFKNFRNKKDFSKTKKPIKRKK